MGFKENSLSACILPGIYVVCLCTQAQAGVVYTNQLHDSQVFEQHQSYSLSIPGSLACRLYILGLLILYNLLS